MNAMPAPSPVSSPRGTDRVDVSVPLRTEFFATLRTVAASLGADAGFSVDELDDLRLAISEVVTSLADSDHRDDDRIDASFERVDAGLAVTLTTQRGQTQIELDELASSILDSVVDEYDITGARVTLVKLASEAPPPATSHAERAPPDA